MKMTGRKKTLTIKRADKIHFTGIKGVGMTAVAMAALDLFKKLTGSDVEEKFVTQELLDKRGVRVSVGFDPGNVAKDTKLLVYTGAHQGENNPQVKWAKKQGIATISQAEAVGQLMEGKLGISVCGVGGKTTVAAMIANILDFAGLKPSFAVGVGNIASLGTSGRYDRGKHFVAEADEYVTSPGTDERPKFLWQKPKVAVVTNICHDHPDVYKNLAATKEAFLKFLRQVPKEGLVVANIDNENIGGLLGQLKCQVITYGKKRGAEWWIKKHRVDKQRLVAEVEEDKRSFELKLQVPGEFNADNAVAAMIVAGWLGVTRDQAVEALARFSGTKRRFEKVGEKDGVEFYDDYGHHPEEIKATLMAAREWFDKKKLIVAFQPHTYSRTKVLLDEFAQAFSDCDRVWLVDIYASAREKVDPSISSEILARKIKAYKQQVKYVGAVDDLVSYARENLKKGEVLLTMGAGDIYKVAEQLVND